MPTGGESKVIYNKVYEAFVRSRSSNSDPAMALRSASAQSLAHGSFENDLTALSTYHALDV